MITTRWSRFISWRRASFSAWRMDFDGIALSSVGDVDVAQQRLGLGRRRGLGGGDRALDARRHLDVELGEGLVLQEAALAHAAAEDRQRVGLAARQLALVLGAIELGVARVMAVEALHLDLDGARAAAGAGALDRLARRFVDGEEVGAVDLYARQAEAARAAGDVLAADRVVMAGALAVAVVLEYEDGGQPQHDGKVHRLEGRALVRSAVAGEGDRDVLRSKGLRRQCRAAHQRRTAAHDSVGPQHAAVEIGDVHRTALAAAQAAVPGKQLLHHRLDVAALGDAMAMAAMGAGDVVAVAEVHAHADRRGFLAGVEVNEARDVAGGKFLLHPVLEGANGAHVAIGADQLVAAQLHAILPRSAWDWT